jgi:hypothetical protein
MRKPFFPPYMALFIRQNVTKWHHRVTGLMGVVLKRLV